MKLRNFKSVEHRRQAMEKALRTDLSNIGHFSLDEKIAGSRNCENMIGVIQMPLGIAGPLAVRSSEPKKKNYYIPLATTEGALVASVNRGCKAINLSGGASVLVERVGATRGPVFKVTNLKEGEKLKEFLRKNLDKIKQTAESTSGHLSLTNYLYRGTGKYRYVRFYYDTQDAMGLNMVTIATQAVVSLIEKETKIKCLDLSGNFCVDKKPSWQNFLNQRGSSVMAEIEIPSHVIKDILKTTADKIYQGWLGKCMIGSAISGSMGFNAQYANVIAAMFIATGQDAAHVVEGSLGITTTEIVNGKNIYLSIYLPDLLVGTVGGGTGLATAKEAMSILGLAGGNSGKNAPEFAGIIGAAVLAGEISLLASLAEGSLARSHERLARGK